MSEKVRTRDKVDRAAITFFFFSDLSGEKRQVRLKVSATAGFHVPHSESSEWTYLLVSKVTVRPKWLALSPSVQPHVILDRFESH